MLSHYWEIEDQLFKDSVGIENIVTDLSIYLSDVSERDRV